MKKLIFIIGIFLATAGAAYAHGGVNVSFGFFYTSLAPHGEWIEIDHDFYVWKPYHVRHNWRPYMHGRWVWSNYGWYWVSYEPFGWATFHYGRWYYDDYYGWVWVPGYQWGPAWVEWRYDNDYIGWAPLPPYATFRISIGIHWTTHWVTPVHHWSFVRYRHMCSPKVHDYYAPVERTRRFFGSTRYSANYNFENDRIINHGINRDVVEKRGGDRIRTVDIVETRERRIDRVTREGDRARIEVYSPTETEINRSRPESIKARKTDRQVSLDLEKVDRTIFQERSVREERRSDPSIEKQERKIQERSIEQREGTVNPEKKQRDIYKEEQKERKTDRSIERKYEDRRTPEKQQKKIYREESRKGEDKKIEMKREEQKRESKDRQREIRPERKEREIEIRREQVKPKERKDEPRMESRPRNERDNDRSSRQSRSRRD